MFRRPQMILLIRFLTCKHLLIYHLLFIYLKKPLWKNTYSCNVKSHLKIWPSEVIWSNKSRKNLHSVICEVRKKHTSLEVLTPLCFLSCRRELISLSWLLLSLSSVLMHEHLAQICLFLYMVIELWIFWELTSVSMGSGVPSAVSGELQLKWWNKFTYDILAHDDSLNVFIQKPVVWGLSLLVHFLLYLHSIFHFLSRICSKISFKLFRLSLFHLTKMPQVVYSISWGKEGQLFPQIPT